ncbi:MAG: GNAT family N-acetyltransferase [Chloroflexi bacterium]|nr:GNAT family N-acetyltransferase [Chloroflexota bacterium]
MTERGTVSLRPAMSADAERIASLFTEEGFPVGASGVAERLERFRAPGSRVVVAELGGEVLGFIALHVVPRFEQDEPFVRIVALVVDPGVRERGVGRLLMDEAERVGARAGATFVEVTAGRHRVEAKRLYESLGYDSTVTTYLRKRLEAP